MIDSTRLFNALKKFHSNQERCTIEFEEIIRNLYLSKRSLPLSENNVNLTPEVIRKSGKGITRLVKIKGKFIFYP